jgi:hypothetical protein
MRITAALILLSSVALPFMHSVTQQQTDDFLSQKGISSIAVLPPLGESVPSSARQLAADLFVTKLKARAAGVRLLGADETLSRLQQKEETKDFGILVTTLTQTGIADAVSLKRIGEVAGTDAILLIHVLNYDEEKGSWWYGKGGKNVCRIQYTLFRSSNAERLWETLEFRQHDSKLSTNPYPMERVIGDVSDKAIASLLSGKQNIDVRKKDPK